MPDKSCININFDSLGWSLSAYGNGFTDPSFFHIADRFFELSDKYGFKYTIFIIGKDLENPQVAARVREWSDAGHEIGNHSYSHRQDIGCLSYGELEAEVMRSHELIAKACGKEPKGFIAPAWAASAELADILLKNGYLYDTSIFPSYFMWLCSAKVWWNFRNDERKGAVLRRKDRLANLFASRKPYFLNGKSLIRKSGSGLLIIPLPVTAFLRIPCWHTMSFFLPKPFFDFVLDGCLSQKYFYYLMHPADLFDRQDIAPEYRDIQNLERLDIPLSRKARMAEERIEAIARRSSGIVTLRQIADEIIFEAKESL